MSKRGQNLIPQGLSSECVYCGEDAACSDHFEPWSIHKSPYTLPACTPCNATLAASTQKTMGGRCDFLIARIAKYNKTNLATRFGHVKVGTQGNLRNHLTAGQYRKTVLTRRLKQATRLKDACGDIALENIRPNSRGLYALVEFLRGRWSVAEEPTGCEMVSVEVSVSVALPCCSPGGNLATMKNLGNAPDAKVEKVEGCATDAPA